MKKWPFFAMNGKSWVRKKSFLLIFSARDDLVIVSWKSDARKCLNQVTYLYFDQLSERYQPLFEGKKLRRFPFFFQIFCCEKMWVGPKLALLQEDQLPMSFKSDQRFNFPPLTTMAIGMDLFHLKPARPTDIWFIAFLTQQRNSEKCQKAITKFLDNKSKKYEGAFATIELHFVIWLLSLIVGSLSTCVSEPGLPDAAA